LVTPKKVLGIV